MDDDDDEGLLNVDLDTSPSFDVAKGLKANKQPSSRQNGTNASAPRPPSTATASPFYQQQRELESVHWLQGTNKEISQRDLIERQKQANLKEQGDVTGTQRDMVLPQPTGEQGEGGEEDGNNITIGDRIRKTAVAVTGSALVATGTVMLITPLHPLGHPVQMGGLGVLATEFEGPKKAYNKSKDFAQRLSGTKKRAQGMSNGGQPKPPLPPNTLQNTSEMQRNFASTSYVSPYRKQSIPNNEPPSKQKAVPPIPNIELKRQGSTNLSTPIAIGQPPAKQKATKKPSIPKSELKRNGSTSLSGGI
ncbi:MAG: hypothetical protein SGBAC_013317 [Bacillariaceae sp.]